MVGTLLAVPVVSSSELRGLLLKEEWFNPADPLLEPATTPASHSSLGREMTLP